MFWFYRKWLNDIEELFDEDGFLTARTAPPSDRLIMDYTSLFGPFYFPMRLFCFYNDMSAVKRLYPMLKKNLLRLENVLDENGIISSKEIINSLDSYDNTYADWLSIERTPNVLVFNAWVCQICSYMEEYAGLLGEEGDKLHWKEMFERIKNGYNNVFYNSERLPLTTTYYGSCNGPSQYGLVLPLSVGIVQEDQYDEVLKTLLWHLQKTRGSTQLSTGIHGTKCVIDFLDSIGRNDIVAELFSRRDYPGWGFMINCGATTVWERWNYVTQTGMNSHDHEDLASSCFWFYRGLCGIHPGKMDKSGRRIFTINPYVPKHLDWAEASWDSPWGKVSSGFKRQNGTIIYNYTIPPNTMGEILIQGRRKVVGPGIYTE
jgi:alpha-L-rhamnosidase